MKSLNRVSLLGTVGRDPEVKATTGGTAVAKFSIALNEKYKDKSGEWVEKTEWVNLVCWKRLAEIAGEYVKKGSRVYVEGKIQTSNWEDKKTGTTKYSTEVVVSELILLDGKSADSKPAPKPEIDDSDIPF